MMLQNHPARPSVILILFASTLLPEVSLYQHKGKYSGYIDDVFVTIPRRVNSLGEHISDNTRAHHTNQENVHFNVTIKDREHLLVLKPSTEFLAPYAIIERHKKSYRTRRSINSTTWQCHYQGFIHNQQDSRVAISACNGLVGVIDTSEEKYWIEPAHHEEKEVQPGHKHIIFKRSAVKQSHRKHWKKKHKYPKNCGTREPKKTAEVEWLRKVGKLTVQEKRTANAKKKLRKKSDYQKRKLKKYKQLLLSRRERSVSKPRYVEALLVADQSMVEFHENEDIETYLLTIMNMVSSVYLDPTIGNLIKVIVVKIILLDENDTDPPLNVLVNADITLRNFCKWQKSLNSNDNKDPYHHDVAVLVTRKNICARANSPCSTLGVAHIGGMCKQEKSCSVNEDNGITLAHTIAHEMGHNFGMFHDTEKIGCKGKEGNRLHVMTPSFEVDTIGVSWSKCSRRDVTTFLDKGLGECLQDEPKELKDYRYPKLPAGAMYNADFQCRLQFGTEAKVCSSPSEICSSLWCEVNNTCTSQLRPAAPGTRCGKHKWCQDQKCVPVVDPPVAIDGGWGEWSNWSECSRTCGAGVSIRHRKCDHPKPSGGGKYCIGERRRYKMCNIEPCPEDKPSFRATQCSSYNNHTYNGKKYSWLPYFDQDEPCELYCSDLNDTIIVPWGEHALDGTPCNVGTRDVCISGICRKVGCDWVVDSAAQEDACGVCQGDGTKCNTIDGIFSKQSLDAEYKEIVTIPADARNIHIEEMNQTENYIGIGSVTSKKFYLNGKRHITLAGEYTVAGAQALYERDNEWEKIRIPGPIKEPIVIYVIFKGKTINPGVKYQYTISKREPKTLKYTWALSEWSQCSVTCGGGTQYRKALCQEIVTGSSIPTTIVDASWCDPSDKPEKLMRTCNVEICPFHWWAGPWHPCPATCSSKGEKIMRRRDIMCVEGKEMLQTDQYCDRSTRPHEFEPCSSLPLCLEDR